MQFEIGGVLNKRDWLLSTTEGQKKLALARIGVVRPKCTCNENKPQMYISKRGNFFYLSRMPGTAPQHARDCLSHIVPDNIYKNSTNEPSEILAQLWQQVNADLLSNNRRWNEIRDSLLRSAANITVDGTSLSSNLLIPDPFDRELIDKRMVAYENFYAECDDDDGANRYWTIGIIKEISPSKYSYHMAVRHMPGIDFWVKNEKAQSLPTPAPDSIYLALFACRPVHSGVAVSDIAVVEMSSRNQPIQTKASIRMTDALSEADKIKKVAGFFGLPPETSAHTVFSLALDHCLACDSFHTENK
jgi:hypothetical protein